jgi:hypothetical protein
VTNKSQKRNNKQKATETRTEQAFSTCKRNRAKTNQPKATRSPAYPWDEWGLCSRREDKESMVKFLYLCKKRRKERKQSREKNNNE